MKVQIILADSVEALTDEQFDSWDTQRQRKWINDHPTSKFAQKRRSQLRPKDNHDEGKKQLSPVAKVPERARRKVVALLDKLKQMTDKAQSEGGKAPNFDLCDISVPGTNLFCKGNKGIPREKMPQLKGKPLPGTPAEKLVDEKGEANAEKAFVESLKSKGVKMKPLEIDASRLKSTQSQLVGAKVAGMTAALKKNPNHPAITAPIFVSRDGYILDGHHRWAAVVVLSLNADKPVKMRTIVVDMDAKQLVNECNNFATSIGIEQKGA